MRRTLVALAAAAAACLTAAAPAGASSIVYIKQGNVWLSSPDGSLQRQVTTDGGYTSPSQADDGNIVALQGGQFVHIDRHGHLLNPPVNGLAGASGGTVSFGPQDPRVSPDDSKIAYDIGVESSRYDPTTNSVMQTTEYQTLYTSVSQFTDPTVSGVIRDYSTPSWINNQTALVTATGIGIDQFAIHLLGGGDTDPTHFNQWFSDLGSPKMTKAELTRAQDKLVTLAGNASENIGIYSMPAAPPATPTLECVVNEPGIGTNYDDPTWSPDGSELAYAKPDGVYVTPVGDISGGDCSSISPKPLLPGASQPFWGPADVSPTDGFQAAPSGPSKPSSAPSKRHPAHRKPVRKPARCVAPKRHRGAVRCVRVPRRPIRKHR